MHHLPTVSRLNNIYFGVSYGIQLSPLVSRDPLLGSDHHHLTHAGSPVGKPLTGWTNPALTRGPNWSLNSTCVSYTEMWADANQPCVHLLLRGSLSFLTWEFANVDQFPVLPKMQRRHFSKWSS